MLRGINMVSIDAEVSTKYNYSNFGYGILGTAMANLMGESLSVLMTKHIFTTYDMENSSLELENKFRNKLATPYLAVAPYLRTEPWNMGTLSGAGNLFSTVSDLNKFMVEVLADREINSIQQTKYFRINESWSYGLGCFLIDSKKRNTKIIYHGGDIDGYASDMSIYPEHELGIVILSNWGEGSVVGEAFTEINKEIVNHFMGLPSKN